MRADDEMLDSLRSLGVAPTNLTPEEIDFLDRNGYVALRGVLDEQAVATMRDGLRELGGCSRPGYAVGRIQTARSSIGQSRGHGHRLLATPAP